VLDFLSATLRLTAVLFLGIASLIIWGTKKMFSNANSGTDAK
jgi:hypothetical protein